ncbi:PEP/pyruvate-binding domain-containing protein, partial [Lysinibacillus varians]
MILTGPEIIKAHKNKEIIIEPFLYEHVNPNSYNFRIGNKLRIYTSEELDPKKLNEYEEIEITEEGYLLEPNKLYLAHTIEKMGSNNYAPTFAARSSIARLGLFINLSASLGDIGFIGQWTLQLCATHPLKVYSGMPIGQIMWWKPKGRIELYNGKYQSSNGPRSSEIYMDFNKTKKHTLLPVLGSLVNENIVGNKFNSLSILSKDYLVPKAFCISTEFLEQFMFTAQIKTQLFNEMIDIKSTVGAFIRDSSKKINSIMEDIYINEQGIAIIIERIDEIFGDCNEKGKYAIRSSGTNEDGKQNSYAGIHDSFLNVSGMKNIIKSIEKVVKSYYSATAIIQRVTNGDFSSNPEIAVIVQEMIDSQEAGVAFSEKYNNEIIVSIESVKGLGEQLVSGVVESSKEIVSKENYLEKENNIQKIYSLASSIQEYHGYDVDIEWSILHEKIYLLQCRPITKKTVNDKKENIKQFSFFDLYHENPPKSFEFKEVAEIYVSYTNKRKKSIEIANKYGFKTSLGFVLNYNKLGLQDFKFNSNKLLENMFKNKEVNSYSKFVLDFNQFSRQII